MALLMGALVKRKRGQLMKILIVGGVAAGTKAAAKLKRLNPAADVTILTKGKDISYAGCGLPYYVGGLIPEKEDLIVNTPAKFTALTGAKVLVAVSFIFDQENPAEVIDRLLLLDQEYR